MSIKNRFSFLSLLFIVFWGFIFNNSSIREITGSLINFAKSPITTLNKIEESNLTGAIPEITEQLIGAWKKYLPAETQFFVSPEVAKDPGIYKRLITILFPVIQSTEALCGIVTTAELENYQDPIQKIYRKGEFEIVCTP